MVHLAARARAASHVLLLQFPPYKSPDEHHNQGEGAETYSAQENPITSSHRSPFVNSGKSIPPTLVKTAYVGASAHPHIGFLTAFGTYHRYLSRCKNGNGNRNERPYRPVDTRYRQSDGQDGSFSIQHDQIKKPFEDSHSVSLSFVYLQETTYY